MSEDLGSAHVWIGPTKCDKERESRERYIEEIWNMLRFSGAFDNVRVYAYLSHAFDQFREAPSCYQNGTYLAACAMCRTAIESLLYLATTRLSKDGKPATISGSELHMKRRQIIERAHTQNIISADDEEQNQKDK